MSNYDAQLLRIIRMERDRAYDEIERLRAALETLTREAAAVANDHHEPRYTRLDEVLVSAREALRGAEETKPAIGPMSGKCARCGTQIEVGWVLCAWCVEHDEALRGAIPQKP